MPKEYKILVSIIGVALAALVLAHTVPVVPDKLPPDVWEEEEFARLKPRIEAASEKLNRMTFDLTESGYDPPITFNLEGKYGYTTVRKALLGHLGNRLGLSVPGSFPEFRISLMIEQMGLPK